jgi:xanthine dehydrogenase accessory factor
MSLCVDRRLVRRAVRKLCGLPKVKDTGDHPPLRRACKAKVERVKGALATVVATRKSSPRPVGSKLIVTEDGKLEGSVSGGCVESDVVLAAQEVLAGGEPRLLTYGITDDMALSVGLPCGGEIDVFVEPLE